MKTTKRILAALLAMMMLACMLCTGAFAAAPGNTGSITITNTVANATYEVFKMFEIESINGSNYYKPTESWKPFFAADGDGALYGTVAANGYIVWGNQGLFSDDAAIKETAAAAFAKLAQDYAENLTADATVTSTGSSVVIENLATNAYYLVDSSLGGTAIAGPIDSNGTFTINEKNSITEAPTIVKSVGPVDAEYMSVDLGEKFNFKVVLTLNEAVAVDAASGVSVTFTDVMPNHIYVTENSLQVTLNDQLLVKDTDYKVVRDQNVTAESVTHVVTFIRPFAAGDVLTFTYEGQLVAYSGQLPVVHEMYTNLAKAEYGDKSVSDTASVFTLAVNGNKYYMNDEGNKTPLGDAKFVLKDSDGKYYKIENDVVSWVDVQADATVMTSGSDGKFSFFGIAAGNYTLVETEAPAGYTGAADIALVVDRNLTGVEVENIKGAGMLPSTGGMGTTVFYVVGIVLILGAVALLITQKRSRAN